MNGVPIIVNVALTKDELRLIVMGLLPLAGNDPEARELHARLLSIHDNNPTLNPR
jgi:hypothetical protein